MKTVTLTSKNQLTLPAALVRQLGLANSRKLLVQKRGNSLLITPQKDIASQFSDIQTRVKPYVSQQFSDQQLKAGRQEAWLNRQSPKQPSS